MTLRLTLYRCSNRVTPRPRHASHCPLAPPVRGRLWTAQPCEALARSACSAVMAVEMEIPSAALDEGAAGDTESDEEEELGSGSESSSSDSGAESGAKTTSKKKKKKVRAAGGRVGRHHPAGCRESLLPCPFAVCGTCTNEGMSTSRPRPLPSAEEEKERRRRRRRRRSAAARRPGGSQGGRTALPGTEWGEHVCRATCTRPGLQGPRCAAVVLACALGICDASAHARLSASLGLLFVLFQEAVDQLSHNSEDSMWVKLGGCHLADGKLKKVGAAPALWVLRRLGRLGAAAAVLLRACAPNAAAAIPAPAFHTASSKWLCGKPRCLPARLPAFLVLSHCSSARRCAATPP